MPWWKKYQLGSPKRTNRPPSPPESYMRPIPKKRKPDDIPCIKKILYGGKGDKFNIDIANEMHESNTST